MWANVATNRKHSSILCAASSSTWWIWLVRTTRKTVTNVTGCQSRQAKKAMWHVPNRHWYHWQESGNVLIQPKAKTKISKKRRGERSSFFSIKIFQSNSVIPHPPPPKKHFIFVTRKQNKKRSKNTIEH